MKRKSFFILVNLVVIFSILAGLTTASAQALKPGERPASLDTNNATPQAGLVSARWETLYFSGTQWTPVSGWNPYSSYMNNLVAINQKDAATVVMFETPYIYDMLDGQVYPLLADGPYAWNEAGTVITFTLKTAAFWSDGTPVTAYDVAYTWASNVKYGTNVGNNYKDYILDVTAADIQTVSVMATLDLDGKAINPLMVENYLSSSYVIQKAWTQTLEARTGGDAGEFLADPAEDVVYSGPYHKFVADSSKVVLVRDDNYWGQDPSMWGKLPVPKYLGHVFYASDEAVQAFITGGVDVTQTFIPNVQDLWLEDGLPISTYLPEAPYQVGAALPTAFYNLNISSLQNVAIRKAIAIAIDYDTIVANAMSNQSATFEQVPRSLMNSSPYEQGLYDHDAVKDLQWTGNDIFTATQILDTAGITDTNDDGWREDHGEILRLTATCPNGWSDWQAAIEVIAAAGRNIGIFVTTNYPEWSDYQVAVTNWPLPAGYDIFMMWSDGAGPTQPWNRIRHLISSEFAKTGNNWSGNWGGYINPAADALIQAIPGETDPGILKAYYTELTAIYLTDVPSFTVMYRPDLFYTVNASIWKGFPHQADGSEPAIPPMMLTDGYSIAGLYTLQLAGPYHVFVPVVNK